MATDAPAVIEPGRLYLAREARARLRLGMPAWRELVQRGLRTVRVGRNAYVLGDDLIRAFAEQQRFCLTLAFGKMLKWAQDNGAVPHKLAKWMCPYEGWMTQERQIDFLRNLERSEPNHAKRTAELFGKTVTDYDLILDTARFCAEVPRSVGRFAVVSMCDVVLGCCIFSRKEPPSKNPFGFVGCANWRPECLFGVVDMEAEETVSAEQEPALCN